MNLVLQKQLARLETDVARKTADQKRRAQHLPRRPSATPYIGHNKEQIAAAAERAKKIGGDGSEPYMPVPDHTPYVDPFDVMQEKLAELQEKAKPTVGAKQLELSLFAEAAE